MGNIKPLRLGAAYHGNRMPRHAMADLQEMAVRGLDIVVHMFSHTDWDRHKNVMKDIVSISEDAGLEVWVDNWGLGGPPGDKSHFLAYYPDSHMFYSNGEMVPTYACLNSPDFRRFVKEWIDAVVYLGAKTIFWDEPHMPQKAAGSGIFYGCACSRCRKLFEDRYERPMPPHIDADTSEFGADSIADYLRDITEYSAGRGVENVACVMLGTYGMSLEAADKICSIPTLNNIGSDPYWLAAKRKDPGLSVYEFVYKGTKRNLEISTSFGKDHNIWIQTYSNPRGREEEIIEAVEGAYDAGARTILAWGYYGSESNDYRAENAPVCWARTCEAFARIKGFERDRILAENRKRYMI